MGLRDLLPQPTGKPVIAAMLLCKGGATRGAGRKERQRDTIRRGELMVAERVAGREWQRRRQSNAVAIKPDGEFTRERKVNSWPNTESRRRLHVRLDIRWFRCMSTGAHASMRGTTRLVYERERERGSHLACVVPIPGRTLLHGPAVLVHMVRLQWRAIVFAGHIGSHGQSRRQSVIGSCWLTGGIALAGGAWLGR